VKIKIEPKEINRLLPTDILFQTSFWSYVKYRLGWTPHAFDFLTEEFHGDVLVLIKSIGQKYSIAYVPQGPEYGPDSEFQGLFLEELSRQMIKHLDQGTVFIRYDLPWESPYAKNDNCNRKEKNWTGHPDTRLRELRMNFGTKDWNLKKATLDIVPADSLILKVASVTFAWLKKKELKYFRPPLNYSLFFINFMLRQPGEMAFISVTINILLHYFQLLLTQETQRRYIFCLPVMTRK